MAGDGSFDAVTMNFGILHLSEPQTAMAQARRVLTPGGRFAFTAWIDEGNAAAKIVEGAVAEHAVPVELLAGPATTASPTSTWRARPWPAPASTP
jgi:ubiquinone/menaquinone biosynthesis C-methylase UbiE